MTRSISIERRQLLAIIVAVLAVTAVPASVVSASDQHVVGSQHTTTSDFENAQTLTNLSAANDRVSLSKTDGFEDGDISEYKAGPDDSLSDFETVLSPAKGSYALNMTVNDSDTDGESLVNDTGPSPLPKAGDTFSFQVYNPSGAQPEAGAAFGRQDKDNLYLARYDAADGELELYNRTGGSYNLLAREPVTIPDEEWMGFTVEWGADGNITVTLDDASGSQLQNISAKDTTFSEGGFAWDIQGGAGDHAYVDNFRVGEEIQSATYEGPIHNVTNPQEAAINISALSNVSVNATVRTDGGVVLNQTTLTSTANHTLALSNTSSEKVEVVLDINIIGDFPEFGLSDESILFANRHPNINNASASPSGGETVSETPVQLSINVSDDDFGTAQGDSLTVTFYDGNGNQLDTDNLTSNGTATGTWDSPPGGERQWYVVVEDDYGGTTTSDTFTFKAPDTLYIRNESAPDALVDSAAVEVTFFASDKVVERSTSNGTIDLSGLPTDEKIVVVADADDYYSRHIILDNIYEQDSVYLLNTTETAVSVTFENADETGEWPPETTEVIVEKGLTQNNSTTYRTLAADEFGVSGFTTTLSKDERYRIKVRNARGDVRILGSHTSSQDEIVKLRPVPTGIDLNDTKTYNGIAYYENVTTSDGYEERIVFEYEDKADATTDLVINIYEQGNKSNTLGSETTIDGPLGSAIVSEVMTDEQANKTWIVDWEAQRNGETIGGQIIVGPHIHEQVSELDQWVREAIAVFVVIMTAALFSQLNRGVGAVSTSLVGGGFWYTGWLPAEAGGAIGLALGVAIAYKIARGQGGRR